MNDNISVGKILKRYISMRGLTVTRVADMLGKNYKTLVGRLNRNAVDAELLFQLAN